MHLRRVIASVMIALSLGLLQCSNAPGASNIGAPCSPLAEKDPAFNGFKVTEETIDVGAPECGGGVCLINHFQGRVSCPLGQSSAGTGSSTCQEVGVGSKDNAGKACCVTDADTHVTGDVCGQCSGSGGDSTRNAENAVYCTCRCGVADGAPDEPDYNFCSCPDGFECSEIRKNFGLGDPTLSGKYCIKQGTAFDPNQDQCGKVDGYWSAECGGIGTGQCQTPDGPCN